MVLVLAAGCEFRPDSVSGAGGGGAGGGRDAPGTGMSSDDAAGTPPPVGGVDASPGAADAAPGEGEEEESDLSTTLPTVTWGDRRWAWDRNDANVGYPQFAGEEVTLTPNVNDRAGVIFPVERITPPFTISFEYLTFDDDGCTGTSCQWSSADGWAFMFGKDIRAYETGSPPTASARAFISDGTGVGVHFELYGSRRVTVKDGTLRALHTSGVETYSEEWRAVAIDVRTDRVEVYLDDSSVFRYDAPNGSWGTSHPWIGIGAGTGGAAAMHKIRNVTIE